MNSYGDQALEARVRAAFEAMPACELKRALGELVVAWAYHLQHVRCFESQADGAPCQDVEPDCVSCLGLPEALQRWTRAR